MNLQVKAMRVRELLEKGSKKHEAATESNKRRRGIGERQQGT